MPEHGMDGVPWTPLGYMLPEGSVLKYRFRGLVKLKRDPLYLAHCAEFNESLCPDGPMLGPVGHPSHGWFGVRGGIRTANGGDNLSTLGAWDDDRWEYRSIDTDTDVYVRRVHAAGYFHSKDHVGPDLIPMYQVEAGQHSLELVPMGLTVTVDRELAPPGDSVTFTAAAYGGTATSYEWKFFPDAGGMLFVGSRCRNHSSCTWPVDQGGPGSMRAEATMDGARTAWSHSPRIAVGVPQLKLTCNGPEEPGKLERGQEITCTASTEPAGGVLELTGWTFEGEGHIVHRDGSEAHHATWSGPMVVGGTVTIRGTVDGSVVPPANASVTMTPRNWRWGPGQWSYEEGAAPVPPQFNVEPVMGAPLHWGWNCTLGAYGGGDSVAVCMHGARVQPDLEWEPEEAYAVQEVSGGPNQSLWHVTRVSFRMTRGSNINPHVHEHGTPRQLPSGSQANQCRQQMGLPSGTPVLVNLYTFNAQCKSEDMTAVIRGLWHHEGFGSSNGNGHEAMGHAAASLQVNDPHAALEDIVMADSVRITTEARRRYDEINTRVTAAANKPEPTGNWSGRLWIWNPAINAYERSTNTISF